jgi:hypothetical protein
MNQQDERATFLLESIVLLCHLENKSTILKKILSAADVNDFLNDPRFINSNFKIFEI